MPIGPPWPSRASQTSTKADATARFTIFSRIRGVPVTITSGLGGNLVGPPFRPFEGGWYSLMISWAIPGWKARSARSASGSPFCRRFTRITGRPVPETTPRTRSPSFSPARATARARRQFETPTPIPPWISTGNLVSLAEARSGSMRINVYARARARFGQSARPRALPGVTIPSLSASRGRSSGAACARSVWGRASRPAPPGDRPAPASPQRSSARHPGPAASSGCGWR